MSRALGAREAHVWVFDTEHALSRFGEGHFQRLLSEDERERERRFVFERDRLSYLSSHGLLRMALSQYASVAPERWVFRANMWGRPELAGPAAPTLAFSLSHSDRAIAVAVSGQAAIGVDVEPWDRAVSPSSLEDLGCAAPEIEDLRRLPPRTRRLHFLRLWTLKEAYTKARGRGLSLDFCHVAFTINMDGAPTAHFEPALADEPQAWHFSTWAPLPGYCLAVAVRRRDTTVSFLSLEDF